MAKKKQAAETGPGVFMILCLVFFVLASAILGVTTYLGFEGQGKWEKEAETARTEQKKAAKNFDEATAKLIVNRIAMGIETADDRNMLSGAAKANSDTILTEHKDLRDKLANSFPKDTPFTWKLMSELAAGNPVPEGTDGPSVGPNKNIKTIVSEWVTLVNEARAREAAAVLARKQAETRAAASQQTMEANKMAFDNKVKELGDTIDGKIKEMEKSFVALKATADAAAEKFKGDAAGFADAKAKLEEEILVQKKNNEIEKGRVRQLLNPDPSDLEARWRSFNVAKTAERMGTVSDKTDKQFVTLTFKDRMNLVPGQTFVVIPSTGSLVEVINREKALEKYHYEFASLGGREAFTGNEMIKGTVEVTDVTSPYSARARITSEPQEIRNPIGKNDQIFNLTLSAAGKEHVAFAGIIDLDGDGRPNNEEFIKILERNNLTIDAYLDLKTGKILPRPDAMSSRTKFLIVGNDAPMVGNIKRMVDQAKQDSIQVIDARMFLHLIGVKPPKGAAVPAYTTVNLGDPIAVPKEGDPMAPPVVPDSKEVPDPKKQ